MKNDEEKVEKAEKTVVWTGNEAIVEGALRAGVKFCGIYPISPVNDVGRLFSERLPEIGGIYFQGEDEIASIAAAIGASIAGKKAITITSGPGFSLKQEFIGYACMTQIPIVIVDGMRKGPATGIATRGSQEDVMQAKWGTHGDHSIIVLCPESVLECYTFTIRAFNLAEKYRTPVILLVDGIVAHMEENIIIPKDVEIFERPKPEEKSIAPPLYPLGEGYHKHITGMLCSSSTGMPTLIPEEITESLKKMSSKFEDNLLDITDFEKYMMDDAEICIVAYGIMGRVSKEVVNLAREKGIKAGLFRSKIIWPFPKLQLDEISKKVKVFIVPEMNQGQIFGEVLKSSSNVVKINRIDGDPVTVKEILDKIEEVVI